MKPVDFYFQLCAGDGGRDHYFLITPKKYFDKTGELSDESGVADDVIPEGFFEELESTYTFDGNPLDGRRNLMALGFTEINFGFPSCESYIGFVVAATNSQEKPLAGSLVWLGHVKGPYANYSATELTNMLEDAVGKENFEKAAEIRDEINSRK